MPKRITELMPITLNGYDISCDVESGSLMLGRRGAVDLTGLCSGWDEYAVPNLRRWGVNLGYFVNYDTSSTGASIVAGSYVALKSVFDSTASSGVTLTIRASTGVRSVTNPEWSGLVQIDGEWLAAGGTVAQASKGTVNLKGLGELSFYTSST